jgi:hypothetical protein
MSSTTIYAILSGYDWADASVDYVVLRTIKPMEDLKKEYLDKFLNPYRRKVKDKESKGPLHYRTFKEWLIQEGYARDSLDDEVEEVWEP